MQKAKLEKKRVLEQKRIEREEEKAAVEKIENMRLAKLEKKKILE